MCVPSKYFLERGFSEEVLTKYDIGLYNERRSKLHNRSVTPVYDDERNFVIGVSGRAQNDYQHPKWLHSSFHISSCLFNLWFAREYIKKTRQIVIVEGICDLLKLEQAGIHNGIALLGGSLGVQRQFKLDTLGVGELILMTDADSAGDSHAKKIIEECSNFYNIKQIHLPPGKDPADMTTEQLKELLL